MQRFKVILVTVILTVLVLVIPYLISNGAQLISSPISITPVGDSIGFNVRSESLSNLTNLINVTDIFIFNLEGVLLNSNNDTLECNGYPNQSTLTGDASFAKRMRLAPITIANMANNHVLDCGAEGIQSTEGILFKHRILSLGAGQNLQEACKPLLVNIRNWHIAFVSYDFVLSDLVAATSSRAGTATLEGCGHDYGKIRSQGNNLIVASVHYGFWSQDISEGQVVLVNRLLDSGVDLVIGHSPHIPQALMARNGKLAFFSLGNFVFRPNYTMPRLAYTSFVPKISFSKDRTEATIYPITIDNLGIPHIDHGNETISRIAKASQQFNTHLEIVNNIAYLLVARTMSVTTASADVTRLPEILALTVWLECFEN